MARSRRPWAVAPAVVLALGLVHISPAAAASPAGKVPSWPGDAVAGSLLVTAVDDAHAAALVARHGGRSFGRVVHLEVRPGREAGTATRLEAEQGVEAVEPDRLRHLLRTPNDPSLPAQWSHVSARAPAAWDLATGAGAVIAVIDSGMDGRHSDLLPNLIEQVDASTGVVVAHSLGMDNDPCDVGHGTLVGGVAAARGDNGIGVAGVAYNASLVDISLMGGDPGTCGGITDSAVLAALHYAVNRPGGAVDVANLSFGAIGDSCPTSYQAAIDAAVAAGVVVVAAAGNEEQSVPHATSLPASCRRVIAVGATGEDGTLASYSNVNDEIDLVAPGGDPGNGRPILSTAAGGGYASKMGTSFAAPYVAGLVALLRSARPDLTVAQVESVLERTASRAATGAPAPGVGWGLVDAAAAVNRVLSPEPIPEPVAEHEFPVGTVIRVSAGSGATEAVRQAVAMSRFVFRLPSAAYAVVARSDDFADALAGASLGYGIGPLLFTSRGGALDPLTASELLRVLEPGDTVYVLGGSAALAPSVDDEIRALGLQPRRLSGPTREATAAAVADEVRAVLQRTTGQRDVPAVLLANAQQWPDAVSAGSLGAWFGMPILLTPSDHLAQATAEALTRLGPARLYVVGGTVAVAEATVEAARARLPGAAIVRLAGPDRTGTAVAVATEFIRLLDDDFGIDPLLAIAVNLRADVGFAFALSASVAAGNASGVFIPVEGVVGDDLRASARELACRLDPLEGLVAGGADVISETTKTLLNDLLERRGC